MEKQLPKNWVETTTREISTLLRGVSYGKTDAYQEEFENSCLILRGGNIQDGKIVEGKDNVFVGLHLIKEEQFVQKADVVIVGSTGSKQLIGKAAASLESHENVSFGAFLMVIRANKNIDKWFFSYYFQTDFYRQSIRNLAGGVNINNIRKEYIENLYFPLPPLAEQNRIVAKLDSLFAQLEMMKTSMAAIPVLLKNFRQQVLTQAVTGKLTESWRVGKELVSPNEKNVTEKLCKGNEILNIIHSQEGRSKVKMNPVRFIRENEINWTVFTLESVCISIVDCLHETATFSAYGFTILDTNNIEPFNIKINKLRYVDDETYKKWISRLKPEYGDIVYTREGSIGNALMIPENDKYCIGQRTMLFRYSELLHKKYSEIYMNSEVFKKQVNPHIKGVASQHVNIRDLRLLEIPVPSAEEQQEIVSRVESLFAKADVIEKQYKTLKEKIDNLPQAMLLKAFKGELVEQLDTDGDARELLKEIQELRAQITKSKKK